MKSKFPHSSLKIPSDDPKKTSETEKKEKGASSKKESSQETAATKEKKSILSPVAFLGTFVFFLYFLAFVFGGDGTDAPMDIFSHSQKGEFAFLLLGGFLAAFMISRVRGKVNWEVAHAWVIFAVALLVIHLLITSIWPQFSIRETLGSIGQGGSQEEKAQATQERELTPQEKLQKAVDYYTQKWGEPQKVVLDRNQWVKIDRIYENQELHYLSKNKFLAKDDSSPATLKAGVEEAKKCTFWYIEEEGEDLYFKKKTRPTVVYYWKEVD